MTPSGQISDFLRFIDNCKNIKSLLEEYNDHAVRVKADNIRAAALEKEWAVMIKIQQEKIIQVQQAARLVRVELILVNRTIIINKAQLEKVTKEEAGQYIKKAMGKKAVLQQEVVKLAKQEAKQKADLKVIELQKARLKKSYGEEKNHKINEELWKLFKTNKTSPIYRRYIELRIKPCSDDDVTPYNLSRNLFIHLEALLQMNKLVDALQAEEQEAAERQREEDERLRLEEEAERQRQLAAVIIPPAVPAVPVPAGLPLVPPPAPVVIIPPAAVVPAGPPPPGLAVPLPAAAALAGPAAPAVAPMVVPPAAPVIPPVAAAPAGPPPAPIPAAAEPIDDDWVMVDVVVPVEEEVIIPKATTTIEISVATTQKAAVQTKNEPKLEVLPPITETHTSKVENLSIKYEFSPLTNKNSNATDADNSNFDEPAALLLSRVNPKIIYVAPDLTEQNTPDLIKPDKPPYYNTLMLWQDRRRPDKRNPPEEIDRFGYSGDIRVC